MLWTQVFCHFEAYNKIEAPVQPQRVKPSKVDSHKFFGRDL